MDEKVKGQVRAILAFVAGMAVQRGWVTSELSLELVGLGVAAVAAAWSWFSKKPTPPTPPKPPIDPEWQNGL